MLRNRAIQLQFVKQTPKENVSDTSEATAVDLELLSKLAKDHVRHFALAVGSVVAVMKLLDTGCQIAIIAAAKK